MHKAVIYTRVSTPEQVTSGHSLEFQSDRLNELCAGSWNLEVVSEFKEPGISGSKVSTRPSLLAALKFADEHLSKGDFFVTWEISRLARNAHDAMAIVLRLRERGIFFRDNRKVFRNTPEDNAGTPLNGPMPMRGVPA